MQKPLRHGEEWTNKEIGTLKYLARINMQTKDIARQLGRTEGAVRAKASEEGITLMPKDKS